MLLLQFQKSEISGESLRNPWVFFADSRAKTFPGYIYIFGSAFPSLDALGLKGAAVAGRVFVAFQDDFQKL